MNAKHLPIVVVATSWASKTVIVLTQLVVVRLLLEEIGVEGYAIFALLIGLQGWFMLADMGIGSSLQNHISERIAHEKSIESVVVIGRVISVILLLLTIVALYVASPMLGPWFLQRFDVSPAEATDMFFLTGALYIGSAIGGVVYKIWYAERRGYLSNMFPACAALIGLVGVALVGWLSQEISLVTYVAIFLGPTAALPLIVLISQLARFKTNNELTPHTQKFIKSILRRGCEFWLLSVASALTLQVDYLVISQTLNPNDIALYSLMMKVYGIPFFIYTALLVAAWPMVTEYAARSQWAKILFSVHRGVIIGIGLLAVSTLILILLMDNLINVLAPRQEFVVPISLIALMGLYWIVRAWTDTFAMILQSMSKLGVLTALVPIQAGLSISLQYALAPSFGIYGILMGLICSFVLTVSWWIPMTTYHYLRNAESNSKCDVV